MLERVWAERLRTSLHGENGWDWLGSAVGQRSQDSSFQHEWVAFAWQSVSGIWSRVDGLRGWHGIRLFFCSMIWYKHRILLLAMGWCSRMYSSSRKCSKAWKYGVNSILLYMVNMFRGWATNGWILVNMFCWTNEFLGGTDSTRRFWLIGVLLRGCGKWVWTAFPVSPHWGDSVVNLAYCLS